MSRVIKQKNDSNTTFVDVKTETPGYTINTKQDPNSLIIIKPNNTEEQVFSDIIAKSLFKAHLDVLKSKSSTTNENEIQHIILQPTQKLQCPECSRFSAATQEQLDRHILKIHRGQNPFQCYMCEYTTYNKTLFEEHTRIHKGIKPYKCKHCDHRSTSKKNIKLHQEIHRPDNPLKCHNTNCKFIAKHKSSLKLHMDTCQSDAKHKKVSNIHCCRCNFVAHDWSEFKLHKKECEIRQSQRVIKRLFKCSNCGWSSSSKHKVMLHLVHHPVQTEYPAIDLSILKKYKLLPEELNVN